MKPSKQERTTELLGSWELYLVIAFTGGVFGYGFGAFFIISLLYIFIHK